MYIPSKFNKKGSLSNYQTLKIESMKIFYKNQIKIFNLDKIKLIIVILNKLVIS